LESRGMPSTAATNLFYELRVPISVLV